MKKSRPLPETAATTATITVLGPTHQHRPAATRGFQAPRVVLKSPYSQTGPVDKPRGLSMGPLGELPRAFCCNSAISRSLLIGIRRFLVQTWIEFQGGSNGELKTTPKPQKDPLFRVFPIFCAQYGPRPALPRPTFKPNPSQIEISG